VARATAPVAPVARVLLGLGMVMAAAVLAAGTTLVATPAGASAAVPALGRVVIPALGGTYRVTSQGPLDAAEFASSSPDPSAAAAALAALSTTITTYERVWQDAGGGDEVQDLVVRFPTTGAAQDYLGAAQRALAHGEIVGSAALPSIPGARRTTYFATTTEVGVGEAITMRGGQYVALLSFFSSSGGSDPAPVTASDATTVALAQYRAILAAPGGRVPSRRRTVFGVLSLVVGLVIGALVLAWLWRLRAGPAAQRRERVDAARRDRPPVTRRG